VLLDPGPLSVPMFSIIEETVMSKTSADEKTILKGIEDSMKQNKLSPEQKAIMGRIDTRLKLYDATKADSILKLLRNGGKGNDNMGDLIMQDLFKINYDITEKISGLKIPIVVICGRQDPIGVFPAFEIQRLNHEATIYWIERSGHFPWMEEPKAFYEKLFQALK
jgi:proline iminopeptidase